MSKVQKKLPQIYFLLLEKLEKLKQKRDKLQSELTVGSTEAQYREINVLNQHIEVTENRMNQRFKDPTADMVATITKTNQIIYQKQQ